MVLNSKSLLKGHYAALFGDTLLNFSPLPLCALQVLNLDGAGWSDTAVEN